MKRSIRSAQLIAPFGVGAVIDLGTESFACADITHWPRNHCNVIPDNPLRESLGMEVRSPPTGVAGAVVPVSRFPRWVFCQACRALQYIWPEDDAALGEEEPTCRDPKCKGAVLAPMRFIVACEDGHLQDVDWFRWTHGNSQAARTGQCSPQKMEMKFETTGASGGDFNAMTVSCACGAKRTLEGLTQAGHKDRATGQWILHFPCAGRQPWDDKRNAPYCSAPTKVYPRAASNVYYPQTRSAIDLGGREAGEQSGRSTALAEWVEAHRMVGALRGMRANFPGGIPVDVYRDLAQEAMRQFDVGEDESLSAIAEAIASDAGQRASGVVPRASDGSQHGIQKREWPLLSRKEAVNTENLKTRTALLSTAWPRPYSGLFEQITLVDRLREVRALLGFRRVKPDKSCTQVPVDLGRGAGWLPGVAVLGEGIFLKLHEPAVAAWESLVVKRLGARSKYLESACEKWGRTPANVYSSPRFIALHTFAHGLIRRLAFDAGYSSASIRERIYSDGPPDAAAGILLYTGDGDSEGSLGGLVRQGEANRLLAVIQRTLADLSWCSADPVCSELESQGMDGLNAAACHACCLVAETSCSYNNSLLDRRLVVGGKGLPGLMQELLQAGE